MQKNFVKLENTTLQLTFEKKEQRTKQSQTVRFESSLG